MCCIMSRAGKGAVLFAECVMQEYGLGKKSEDYLQSINARGTWLIETFLNKLFNFFEHIFV